MKILAIESSGLVASCAVLEDERLLAEYTTNFKKTHSQTLLPMIETMTKMIDLDLNSIDAIAICGGPGSFTGLRIGAATAKGLGLALKKPLIPVPTVDGLAYNLPMTDAYVCPLMDARRNQVYTGVYSFSGSRMEAVRSQCAVEIDEILNYVNQLNHRIIFLGDGVPVFKEYIQANCKAEYAFAPAHVCEQRAGALGALAMQYLAEGKIVDAASFAPDYLRLSQAERERLEKENGNA